MNIHNCLSHITTTVTTDDYSYGRYQNPWQPGWLLHPAGDAETPMYSPLRVTSTFKRFPTRCAWCITPRTLISSTSHLKGQGWSRCLAEICWDGHRQARLELYFTALHRFTVLYYWFHLRNTPKLVVAAFWCVHYAELTFTSAVQASLINPAQQSL